MLFSTIKPAQESFLFYKEGTKFDNPEVAFHDMRLHWKEDCYVELDFPNAYKSMVSFAVEAAHEKRRIHSHGNTSR